MGDFERWWDEAGSGIRCLSFCDIEEHTRKVSKMAWEQSKDIEPLIHGVLDNMDKALYKDNEIAAIGRFVNRLISANRQV